MAYFHDGPYCCSSLSWPQCNKGIFRWFDALGLIRQNKVREIRSNDFVFLLHARRARLSHVARMALTDIGYGMGHRRAPWLKLFAEEAHAKLIPQPPLPNNSA